MRVLAGIDSYYQCVILDLQNLLVLCTLHVRRLLKMVLCLSSRDQHIAIVGLGVSFFKDRFYSLQECSFNINGI